MQQAFEASPKPTTGIDAAVSWFLDLRFGLFVHWGPGAGSGKPGKLTASDHAARERVFEARAEGFDAQHFVSAAEVAGARYLTFVPKHAYDFCLWPTRVTESHTQRDFLGELADACRAKGLPLFIYMNLNAAGYVELAERDFADAEAAMEQHPAIMTAWLEELVAYQPAGIWFDAWPFSRWRAERAGRDVYELFDFERLTRPMREADAPMLVLNKELLEPWVHVLSSEYMFEDHFGNSLDSGRRPTETCDILPGSAWFAERETDEAFLSDAEIDAQAMRYTQRLLSAAGRGSNYLLNAGPLPDGRLQSVEWSLLERVGRWLEPRSEAVFGTRPIAGVDVPWGYLLRGETADYAVVLDNRAIGEALDRTERGGIRGEGWEKTGMPADRTLTLPPHLTPARVRALPGGETIPFEPSEAGITIDIRHAPSDPVATVLALDRT